MGDVEVNGWRFEPREGGWVCVIRPPRGLGVVLRRGRELLAHARGYLVLAALLAGVAWFSPMRDVGHTVEDNSEAIGLAVATGVWVLGAVPLLVPGRVRLEVDEETVRFRPRWWKFWRARRVALERVTSLTIRRWVSPFGALAGREDPEAMPGEDDPVTLELNVGAGARWVLLETDRDTAQRLAAELVARWSRRLKFIEQENPWRDPRTGERRLLLELQPIRSRMKVEWLPGGGVRLSSRHRASGTSWVMLGAGVLTLIGWAVWLAPLRLDRLDVPVLGLVQWLIWAAWLVPIYWIYLGVLYRRWRVVIEYGGGALSVIQTRAMSTRRRRWEAGTVRGVELRVFSDQPRVVIVGEPVSGKIDGLTMLDARWVAAVLREMLGVEEVGEGRS